MTSSHELPRGTPEEVGMSGKSLDRIPTIVQELIDEGRLQGAVVGVSRRGKVVYLKAQGVSDASTGQPLQEDAMFHMASSTKPVLGVAAMMMIEEGKFKPTDPVEQYIPEFKGIQVAVPKNPASEDSSLKKKKDKTVAKNGSDEIPEYELVDTQRPVTIHDLLTHTSGLGSGGTGTAVADWGRPKESDTLATWIPKVAAGPLDFQPGSQWRYSGTVGLDVVARIIEIVSGTPFNEFVQHRIFDPLDMKDTYWNVPEEKQKRMMAIPNNKGAFYPASYFSGSIGLVSTTRDYLHFEQMLLNQGTLFGNQLLKPESVAMMTTNQVGDLFGKGGKSSGGGMGFGYTVSIVQDPEQAKTGRGAGAFGWGGAAGTVSWTDPSAELTAVVMVQQPGTNIATRVAESVRDAIVP